MIVAILGAESTGKTDLSLALAAALQASGHRCAVVAEVLREWCVRENRTPRIDEQAAIAQEQRRRIEAAAGTHELVIADTTPLLTAVYSEWVFGDRSLYADALAWQRECVALTLVKGLDVPWLPDGIFRDGPHVRAPVDALLRAALASAGVPFGLVYGSGDRRAQAALAAVRHRLAAGRGG
jgi:nicotinamide riboside kinase